MRLISFTGSVVTSLRRMKYVSHKINCTVALNKGTGCFFMLIARLFLNKVEISQEWFSNLLFNTFLAVRLAV